MRRRMAQKKTEPTLMPEIAHVAHQVAMLFELLPPEGGDWTRDDAWALERAASQLQMMAREIRDRHAVRDPQRDGCAHLLTTEAFVKLRAKMERQGWEIREESTDAPAFCARYLLASHPRITGNFAQMVRCECDLRDLGAPTPADKILRR